MREKCWMFCVCIVFPAMLLVSGGPLVWFAFVFLVPPPRAEKQRPAANDRGVKFKLSYVAGSALTRLQLPRSLLFPHDSDRSLGPTARRAPKRLVLPPLPACPGLPAWFLAPHHKIKKRRIFLTVMKLTLRASNSKVRTLGPKARRTPKSDEELQPCCMEFCLFVIVFFKIDATSFIPQTKELPGRELNPGLPRDRRKY